MNSPNNTENNFLAQLTNIVKANINNPQLGVSMLAKEMGMSRSNLYLKVNAKLKITVTQFINQARLKEAKEILQHTSITVSEVAYEVGFNSLSHFSKAFRDTKMNQLRYQKFPIKLVLAALLILLNVFVNITGIHPGKFKTGKRKTTGWNSLSIPTEKCLFQ